MKRREKVSVTDFLKSDAAETACRSGNSKPQDYTADEYGRVALGFNGHYTVPEIACLFDDLKVMQAACDAWRGVKRNEWGEVVEATDTGTCRSCAAAAAVRALKP